MNLPVPVQGLRAGALLVGGVINVAGALAVLLVSGGARAGAAWVLVQFLSGVWAGVLGANSPFLHGLLVGIPGLILGLAISGVLPAQFVILCAFVAPAASLVAAAIMRFMRRRG